MTLVPLRDPATGGFWCPLACPHLHRTAAAAAACTHAPPVPYVPGANDNMRRPTYVPATATRVPFEPTTYRPRRRWLWLLGLLMALAMVLSAAVVVFGAYVDTRPGGPVVTPTTYGPPGPNGGPVVVEVAR